MNKKGKTEKADIPRWWDRPANVNHIRDVEDATANLYRKLNFDPKTVKKDLVKFSDLRILLGAANNCYIPIRADDFMPNLHLCFKGMYQNFNRLKANTARLISLIKSKEPYDSQSEDDAADEAPIDQQRSKNVERKPLKSDSSEAEPEVGPEDGKNEDASNKEKDSSSQRTISIYEGLGKRGRSELLTEKECKIWLKIGDLNKRIKMAQLDLYDHSHELDMLLRDQPLKVALLDNDVINRILREGDESN